MYYTVEPLSETGTRLQTMVRAVTIKHHKGFVEQTIIRDLTVLAPI